MAILTLFTTSLKDFYNVQVQQKAVKTAPFAREMKIKGESGAKNKQMTLDWVAKLQLHQFREYPFSEGIAFCYAALSKRLEMNLTIKYLTNGGAIFKWTHELAFKTMKGICDRSAQQLRSLYNSKFFQKNSNGSKNRFHSWSSEKTLSKLMSCRLLSQIWTTISKYKWFVRNGAQRQKEDKTGK